MHITHVWKAVLCLALVAGVAACEDDGAGPDGPFALTFNGDASFQGPHGDQAVNAAVVRADDNSVVATDGATVSTSEDPAFSFTFTDVLESGTTYEVHYWIDSNFNGGTAGECDPGETDHQWSVNLGQVSRDVTLTASHDATEITSVCSTFGG